MAAHGAYACAGAADMAPHEQKIDQHGDILKAMDMLRKPHAIHADHALGLDIDPARFFDIGAGQSRFLLDPVPCRRIRLGAECIEAQTMFVDKRLVDQRAAPAFIFGKHIFAQPHDRRDVAARAHLQILATDRRTIAGQHLGWPLRVDEFDQPLFANGVEGHDFAAAFDGFLQGVQEARTVGAGILPEKEDRVALFEIVENACPDRRPDQCVQRNGRRFVTHVRTVGQIVMPIKTREQRIDIGGFQARATRCVEYGGLGINRLQFRTNLGKRLVPTARHIMVAGRVIAQGVGQPPLMLQIMVAPAAQLGHAMFGKKVRRAAMRGQFPQGRLRTIFAKFKSMGMLWLPPGTTGTHEAAGLVLAPQCFKRTRGRPLAQGGFPHAAQ